MKYISIIVIFIFVAATHGLHAQATLSNLALSSGTLSPAFSSATTSYTASVTNATTSITVTPTKTNASASIQVNNVAVNSGTASSAIYLSVGSNTILVKVTYLGGKADILEQSYTIVITREGISNPISTLSSMVLSSGTLSPGFASGTTSYTASVTNATSSITVTPSKTDVNATIRVNNTVVNSGSASSAILLTVGSNVITVTVTAQTGAIQSYTINVTRAVAVDDHGNDVSTATTLGLNASVSGSIETINDVDFFRITLTGTGSLTVQSTGSFDVEGWIFDSAGTQLANNDDGASNLQFVMNLPTATAGTYYLAVRHYDDTFIGSYGINTSFTAAYTINLIPYQPSGWTDRIVVSNVTGTTTDSSILRSSDVLYVDWAVENNSTTGISNDFYYELYVDNILNNTWNSPTGIAANNYAYIQDYAIGSLAPGTHTIRIKADSTNVIGETNEIDNEYTKTIIVLRSSIASLSNLTLNSGTLSPTFASGTTTYTASVTNATSSITVTPTKTDANATIKVNGTVVNSGSASGAIPLAVGSNVITVAVTAQDGTTVRNYAVTVTRAASSVATLSGLVLNSGTLSPTFASGTTIYTASVTNATSSITVTPTKTDANATIKVNGTVVNSGSASGAIPLAVGSNVITVAVTAQDGTTVRNYAVTVARAAAAPEIAIEQPVGSNISDGGTKNFGSSIVGVTVPLTFTIKNTGNANLTGLVITTDGAHASDFTIISNPVAPVSGPSGTTTFIVQFKSSAIGSRSAAIHITSNDSDESPFDINLIGTGLAQEVTDFTYEIVNNTINITGYTGTSTVVTIPAMINGLPVTSIGSSAFDSKATITSVTIPNSVTSIGIFAFFYCSGLTTVTIPSSVTSIGDLAFCSCSKLNAISVASGNSSYSSLDGVLFNKGQTTLVQYPGAKSGAYSIPSSVTSIGAFAFCYSSGLTSISIPSSVTTIGEYALYYCTKLNTISVATGNSSYCSLDGVLFNKGQTLLVQCPGAKSGVYIIPTSVTGIWVGAFSYCSGLTSVTIPSSVTLIWNNAFYYCSGLTSITIPGGFSNIGEYAFSYCSGLTSITIPGGVTSIGEEAFSNCSGLTSAFFTGDAPTMGISVFDHAASGFTVYFRSDATGFTTPTWLGYSTQVASAVATLSKLALSSASLSPLFASGTTTYTASVTNATSSITVTPTKTDANATIKVNGTVVNSGSASGAIPLAVGSNVITVAVTAQDGTTVRNYTVTVTRAASSDDHGNSIATATIVPTTASSIIGTLTVSDEDFFRITVPGNGILIVWSESEIDTYGYLLNAAGTQLDDDNDSNLGANFRISAAVTAGNYYVRLKGNVSTIAGAYNLRTRFIPSSDPIQVSYLEKADNNVNLGFTGSTGVTYYIHGSGDLDTWTLIATMVGTGAENYATLVGQGGMAKRFFRVSNQPPAPAGFVLIPAGNFQMGDSLDGDSSATVHTVSSSNYYIGKKEVTKAEWDEVRTWGIANGYTDLSAGAGKATNHPVHSISWFNIVKWCNARSQKEGLTPCYTVSSAVMKTGTSAPTCNWTASGYRLPTEAEWEKAARGKLSGKRFPWGDTISQSQANYYASSGYSYDLSSSVNNYHPTYSTGGYPYTSPVGSFAANGYGLYDMSGNVWEWCWDWYGTYASGAQTDPRGSSSGSDRVFRGGSWTDYAYLCRSAYRSYYNPSNTHDSIGFRVARSSVP